MQRNFTPITKTRNPIDTGNHIPIAKSLLVEGLEEAAANGEAKTVLNRKTANNPKGAGKRIKDRDVTFYPNHVFRVINKVTIVLVPNSKLEIDNFNDFIHATESIKDYKDIVDILPPLYSEHYNIIADVNKRIMKGDRVIVNFKYRSIIESVNLKQKEPVEVEEIKFVNLNNLTALAAYLTNQDFYPIHELDIYDKD